MLSLYFLMTFCALLLATHFRHGTVKYTQLSSNSVRFTVTIATEGYIGGTGFDFVYGDGSSTFLTTPQCIDTSGTFNSITGCSSDTTSEKYPEVISATSAWTIFRYIFDYTYSTNGNFLAGIDGCCRIHDIQVGSGNDNLVYVRIDFTKSWSGSTVSSLAPIVQFPLDSPYQVSIPMSDPDNQIVTCRKATFTESGIETNTHYNLSAGCIISATFSSSAYFPGDLFATQIILETSDGKQAGVDFLIELVGTIQNNNTSPICSIISTPTGTNGEFEVQQGNTLDVIVTGTDTEDTTLTTLLVNGPSGSSMSPAGTVSSGDNVIFSWLALTSGSFSTTIQFSDSQGLTSECNFAISVISQPVIEQCDINSGMFTYNWDVTFHTAQDGGVQPSITDTITYDTNGGLLLNLEIITNYKINAIKQNDYPNEIFGFTYYLGMVPFDSTGRLLSNANYCENRFQNEFNSLDFWRYWTYTTTPQNNNTFPGNGTYFMEYPRSNWYLSLYNDVPCNKIVYFRSFSMDELINFCSWEFDSTTDENYIILSGNVYLTAVSPHPPSYNPIIDSQVYLTESLLTHPISIYFTKAASIVQSVLVDLFGMNVISTVYDEENNEFKITVVTYVPRYLMLESIPNVVLSDPNALLWTTSEADDTYEHCKILDEYRCWQIFDITTTIGNCSGGYDFGNTYTLFGNVDCLNATHATDTLSQCYEFLDATNNATADDIIDIDTQRIEFVEDCAFSSRFVDFTPYLDLYQDNTFSSIRNPQIDPYSSKGDVIFVEVGLEELLANDNFFGLEIISVFLCTADVAPGTTITGCFSDPNADVALVYDVIHDPLSFTLINSDITDYFERFSFQLPVIADSIFFLEVVLELTLDANTTVRRRQLLQSSEGRFTALASRTVSGSIGTSKNGKNTNNGIDLMTVVIISASCVVLLLCTAIVFCGFYMKKLLNNAKGNGEITMGSIVYSQQQNNKNGNNDVTPHSTQPEIVCTE